MDGLVIGVLLFVAALFFLKFLARNRTRTAPADPLQYRRRPALFTAAERSFAGVLDQVLDGRHRAYGKVRVADLIEPLPAKDRRSGKKPSTASAPSISISSSATAATWCPSS